jgi:hypothetical protein
MWTMHILYPWEQQALAFAQLYEAKLKKMHIDLLEMSKENVELK